MLEIVYYENTNRAKFMLNGELICYCTIPKVLYNVLKQEIERLKAQEEKLEEVTKEVAALDQFLSGFKPGAPPVPVLDEEAWDKSGRQ